MTFQKTFIEISMTFHNLQLHKIAYFSNSKSLIIEWKKQIPFAV